MFEINGSETEQVLNNDIKQTNGTQALTEKDKTIESLENVITEQSGTIESLESQILKLKSEKKEQNDMINKLQYMLDKMLKFATKVRNSRVGKIFFRKQIKELDAGSQDDRDIA